jgi:hypothetical protein
MPLQDKKATDGTVLMKTQIDSIHVWLSVQS